MSGRVILKCSEILRVCLSVNFTMNECRGEVKVKLHLAYLFCLLLCVWLRLVDCVTSHNVICVLHPGSFLPSSLDGGGSNSHAWVVVTCREWGRLFSALWIHELSVGDGMKWLHNSKRGFRCVRKTAEKQLLDLSCLSVWPPVRAEQLNFQWVDFHEIWCTRNSQKSFDKIRFIELRQV
jgi:hypothetical protein